MRFPVSWFTAADAGVHGRCDGRTLLEVTIDLWFIRLRSG